MKRIIYLIPVLLVLISCSNTPTDKDAIQKLNKAANPTYNSLFRFVSLKILNKTASKKNGQTFFIVDYSAVRLANKDLLERKNVMGEKEYIDPASANPNDSTKYTRNVAKGDVLDTLFASMTMTKGANGWE